jgi:hypothetical protein
MQSTPLTHEADAAVYNGPIEPPTGPLVGESGTPPCGQAPARPPATPGPPVPVSGEVALGLADNFFDLDGAANPNFEVAAGDTVTFNLTNTGTAIHNMRVSGPDAEYDTDDDIVSDPDTMTGGATGTLVFEATTAGTFPYRCDFHPTQMLGEITVPE